MDRRGSKYYEGTKRLYAWPMTKQDYVDYRDWMLPGNEDGNEAGYLVEYEDGGDANVAGHVGYVSWSPASVFERTYREISTGAGWIGSVEFTAEQLAIDPILRYFHYSHLPVVLQSASKPFYDLARHIVTTLPRNAERTVTLRKLLEAKDAGVRANVN